VALAASDASLLRPPHAADDAERLLWPLAVVSRGCCFVLGDGFKWKHSTLCPPVPWEGCLLICAAALLVT